MNNNLIIFYKDGSKDVFAFGLDTTEKEALEGFETMRPGAGGNDIRKYFYILNDKTPHDIYGKHAELVKEEGDKMRLNYRGLLVSKKATSIRTRRDMFLKRLDLPFMRSLEDDDVLVKNHITKLKNFLRDLPNSLNLKELSDKEIVQYNPFGNIFEILLVNGGDGYEIPPKVIIDSPNSPNSPAEATAFIKKGKVTRLELINYGCGYDFIPEVTIEPPQKGNQAEAFCGFPQNAFLTDEDLKEATRKRYLRS
jgi:hypothetical protein